MMQYKCYRDPSVCYITNGHVKIAIRDPEIRYHVVNKRPSIDLLTFSNGSDCQVAEDK